MFYQETREEGRRIEFRGRMHSGISVGSKLGGGLRRWSCEM